MADPSHPTAAEGIPAQIAGRVESIVRAAEREAAAVQREIDAQRLVAESEARHYAEESRRRIEALAEERLDRLRELTDDLTTRAEDIRHGLDGLAEAIQEAAEGLASAVGADSAPGSERPVAASGEHSGAPAFVPAAASARRAGPPPPRRPAPPVAPLTPGTAPIPPSLQMRPGAPGPPTHPEPRTSPGPAGIAAAGELPAGVRRRPAASPEPPAEADGSWARAAPDDPSLFRDRAPEAERAPEAGSVEARLDQSRWPDESVLAVPPDSVVLADADTPTAMPSAGSSRSEHHADAHRPGANPSSDDRADAARLVALEMAVAGRSRLEVDQHLREAFGIADTTAILNDVFGPAATASP